MRSNRISYFATLALSLFCLHGSAGCSRVAPNRQAEAVKANQTFTAGLRWEAAGETRRAAAEYRTTLRADPKHQGALRRLATIYTDDQKFSEAIPLWKQYVSATEGASQSYNDLGFCYDLAGYADPAEAAYIRSVEADPANRRARTNYGLMLARHGRVNEALLQLRAAMPPADAHYNLAVILEEKGESHAARREYRRALELNPDLVDAELRMAAIE